MGTVAIGIAPAIATAGVMLGHGAVAVTLAGAVVAIAVAASIVSCDR